MRKIIIVLAAMSAARSVPLPTEDVQLFHAYIEGLRQTPSQDTVPAFFDSGEESLGLPRVGIAPKTTSWHIFLTLYPDENVRNEWECYARRIFRRWSGLQRSDR